MGSTKGVIMHHEEYSNEYNMFKRASPNDTKLVLSTFEHSSYGNQVVSRDTEDVMKKTLYWKVMKNPRSKG